MSPQPKSPGNGGSQPDPTNPTNPTNPTTRPYHETFEEKGSAPGPVVLLGNANPQMQLPVFDPVTRLQVGTRSEPHPILKQSVTRVELAAYHTDQEFVERTLSTDNDRFLSLIARSMRNSMNTQQDDSKWALAASEIEQVLATHSAGDRPRFVRASDPDLQRALAEYFDCPEGEPVMLLTNSGRDAIHAQNLGTSAQPAAFNFMALANSATATAPNATDTSLTGEITTAGGGLIRAQGTYAHTAGTNTSTITKTFTANGTDALPVTVSQMALFNAASSGTMCYKTALNSNATLTTSGDNVTVTETVTAG